MNDLYTLTATVHYGCVTAQTNECKLYISEYNCGYKSMRIMSWKNQAKYHCNYLIFKTVNVPSVLYENLIALVLELLLNRLS